MPYKKVGNGIVYDYLDKYEMASYDREQRDNPEPGITARAVKTVREGRPAAVRLRKPVTRANRTS